MYHYTYDLAGRLTSVTVGGGVPTAQYTYDSNGNRLTKTTPAGTGAATYDTQDRLSTYGDAAYAYNQAGQLAAVTSAVGTTNYIYDVNGALRAVTLSDGRRIDYELDPLNRRIGKKLNGARQYGLLYQDRLRPAAQLDANNNRVALYYYATRANVPDYMAKGGARYRIFCDHLGSVRLVVNAEDGTIVQRMDYDEFGRVVLDTNPGFQPFGFAGGLYDTDTGLVRFGVRDYDASTGRWTAKDPSLFRGGDLNLYRYAGGDPINFGDVNGKDVCVHQSSQGYHHEWVSINNETSRSYGAWPEAFSNPFWSHKDIDNPDGRAKEIGAPGTKTKCYKSTPEQDRRVEDWIRNTYDLENPSNNPSYIFGWSDCRHFVDDVTEYLWNIQGDPQNAGGEGAGGGGGGGTGG